jgi:hypothetical protein
MEEHSELSIVMEDFKLSDTDCSLQVTDAHEEKISSSFCGKWRLLPSHLEMEDIVAEDIDREHPGGEESEKRCSFLKKWKKMRGSGATYRKLINALLEAKCRSDAEGVCKLLQNHVSAAPSCPQQQTSSPSQDESHIGGKV